MNVCALLGGLDFGCRGFGCKEARKDVGEVDGEQSVHSNTGTVSQSFDLVVDVGIPCFVQRDDPLVDRCSSPRGYVCDEPLVVA